MSKARPTRGSGAIPKHTSIGEHGKTKSSKQDYHPMTTLQKTERRLPSTKLPSTASLMRLMGNLPNAAASNNVSEITKFVEVQSMVTLEKAMEGTVIAKLKKGSKSELLKAVSALITTTAMSLNITNNMNSFQVIETATLICDNFWSLRLEELILIFKYERSDERAAYFEKKNTSVNQDPEAEMSQEGKERLAEIYKSLFPESPPEKKELRSVVNPATKEQFIKTLTERVPEYDDEILQSLRKDCITYGHKQELEIVERELKRRKNKT